MSAFRQRALFRENQASEGGQRHPGIEVVIKQNAFGGCDCQSNPQQSNDYAMPPQPAPHLSFLDAWSNRIAVMDIRTLPDSQFRATN